MRKYHLWRSFLQGFLFFFRAYDNPYEKRVKNIVNKTAAEALWEDFLRISMDFKNAFEKHKNQLPPLKKIKQDLD